MKKAKIDIQQKITDAIIEKLESVNASDFNKVWVNVEPANNPISKTVYRGINQLYLSYVVERKNYSTNRWLTFKQAATAGGKIKKGAKSTEIVYTDFSYYDEEGKRFNRDKAKEIATGKGKQITELFKVIPFIKFFLSWNIDQIENLPESFYETVELSEFDFDQNAEDILTGSGARIEYKKQNNAFYSPSRDIIVLPTKGQFESKEAFYHVAYHELTHWTGHEDRLNRVKGNKFGSSEYAYEELIAELGAAFTSAHVGFTREIPNNAAYIKGWLMALKNDKKFIFRAAAMAYKASEYIIELVDNQGIKKAS